MLHEGERIRGWTSLCLVIVKPRVRGKRGLGNICEQSKELKDARLEESIPTSSVHERGSQVTVTVLSST